MSNPKSCYFEPYLALMFISSILFSLIFIMSILQSNNMIQKTCSKIPNVTISDDTIALIDIISKAIRSAHINVQLSFSEINLTIFTQFFLPALQKAHSNGASIALLSTSVSDLQEILNKNKFINFFNIDTASQQISSQSIVADNKAFIAPFVISNKGNNESIFSQLIIVEDCEAISKDISSFVDYYKYIQNDLNPKVFSGNFIAQTSASRPISVQLANKKAEVSQAFMFHNPQSFLIPARIDTIQVLSSLFDEDPSSIDIYTFSPQCLNFFEAYDYKQLNIYFALKSLLMRNKTKVRYLASASSYREKRLSCFSSFLPFDNSELRIYDKKFEGPNYIVAHFKNSKDESYIFSQVISDLQIQNILSIHFATDDKSTANYLRSSFDSVWSKSTPIQLNETY